MRAPDHVADDMASRGLLQPGDAARYANVGYHAIASAIDRGKLPVAAVVGRVRFVRRDDVSAVFSRQAVSAGTVRR